MAGEGTVPLRHEVAIAAGEDGGAATRHLLGGGRLGFEAREAVQDPMAVDGGDGLDVVAAIVAEEGRKPDAAVPGRAAAGKADDRGGGHARRGFLRRAGCGNDPRGSDP
jgi:hypothetical protein